MKVAIVYSRTVGNSNMVNDTMRKLRAEGMDEVFIIGGPFEHFAPMVAWLNREPGLKIKKFYTDHHEGPKGWANRNERMIKECDKVMAFWDGESKTTTALLAIAKKLKKEIEVIEYF